MKKYIIPILLFAVANGAGALSVDHSGSFGNVKDQGSLGLCHIFATVALLESEWFQENRNHAIFSEAYLGYHHIFGKNKSDAENTYSKILKLKKGQDYLLLKRRQTGHMAADLALAKSIGLKQVIETLPYNHLEKTIFELNNRLTINKDPNKGHPSFEKIGLRIHSWFDQWPVGDHRHWLSKLEYKKIERNQSGASLIEVIKEKIKCRPIAAIVSSQIWHQPGVHAIVLTGYDYEKKLFTTRNSFGRHSIFRKHQQLSEEILEKYTFEGGYIENPSLGCFK
jgi:hypothetical protein